MKKDKPKTKIIKLISNLIRLRDFMRSIDVGPTFFLIPLVLSLAVALFEGASTGLLVPLAKGVIHMDFSFAHKIPFLDVNFARISHRLPGPNASVFILLVGLVFALAVIKNLVQYATSLTVSYQASKISHNMRRKIFDRYLCFGKMFFDKNSRGYLQGVLTGFTNYYRNTVCVDIQCPLSSFYTSRLFYFDVRHFLEINSFPDYCLPCLLLFGKMAYGKD